ncbi:ABC transporter related protein [Pseudopedobacter saltans DSM 12145]|uniref:ABC transporter related protein n=1 Tax=Pseudopedobacter saltans (strain ATCC 51119 / DSM 12145 / JCM 21818 / CCUG 39354 / LMG 10337 / NBRC 100064 / NCIMB 13643) TaxID=762903 RepID=F0SDH2_PSESL|nr:ATP-binding cassette domain-containing protein [Pseudopedobacter saltans]ADY53955.1 ABC transporter related protein [Pseudopedobacter saltans DSM 12145]
MITISSLAHVYPTGKKIYFEDAKFLDNENWLILGDSGSGKSTLLNIMTGLLSPTKGQVMLNETNLYQLGGKLDKFRAKHMGIVFQKPYFIQSLNVTENLKLTQSLAGLSKNPERITEVLESLGLIDKRDAFTKELSVGQLQRLSIARAVLNNPSIIFADEPTASLDDRNTEKVLDLLINHAGRQNASLIVATHDKRVKEMISNIYFVNGGNS